MWCNRLHDSEGEQSGSTEVPYRYRTGRCLGTPDHWVRILAIALAALGLGLKTKWLLASVGFGKFCLVLGRASGRARDGIGLGGEKWLDVIHGLTLYYGLE